MSSFEARYDQIEAYLKGALNETEREQFEIELAQNEALKEEVEIQKASRALIEQVYLQEMSAIISEQSVEKPVKPTHWKWVAGAFIAIGVLTFLLVDKEDTSKEVHAPLSIVVHEVVSREEQEEEVVSKVIPNEELKINESNLVLETKSVKIAVEDTVTTAQIIQQTSQVVDQIVTQDNVDEITDSEKKSVKEVALEPECVKPKLTPVRVTDCHLNELDGELLLDESKDIRYSINNSEFNDYPETRGLESGVYSVQLKDNKGCIFDLGNYKIKQSACLKERDIAYNIKYDGVLELPLKESERTEVVLLNRVGEQVFTTELENSNYFEWDGKYDNGNEAVLGLHKLVIKNIETKETCLYNVVIEK